MWDHTNLMSAIEKGDADRVCGILSNNVIDVNQTLTGVAAGYAPVHVATGLAMLQPSSGMTILELLAKHKANFNAKYKGHSPLKLAMWSTGSPITADQKRVLSYLIGRSDRPTLEDARTFVGELGCAAEVKTELLNGLNGGWTNHDDGLSDELKATGIMQAPPHVGDAASLEPDAAPLPPNFLRPAPAPPPPPPDDVGGLNCFPDPALDFDSEETIYVIRDSWDSLLDPSLQAIVTNGTSLLPPSPAVALLSNNAKEEKHSVVADPRSLVEVSDESWTSTMQERLFQQYLLLLRQHPVSSGKVDVFYQQICQARDEHLVLLRSSVSDAHYAEHRINLFYSAHAMAFCRLIASGEPLSRFPSAAEHKEDNPQKKFLKALYVFALDSLGVEVMIVVSASPTNFYLHSVRPLTAFIEVLNKQANLLFPPETIHWLYLHVPLFVVRCRTTPGEIDEKAFQSAYSVFFSRLVKEVFMGKADDALHVKMKGICRLAELLVELAKKYHPDNNVFIWELLTRLRDGLQEGLNVSRSGDSLANVRLYFEAGFNIDENFPVLMNIFLECRKSLNSPSRLLPFLLYQVRLAKLLSEGIHASEDVAAVVAVESYRGLQKVLSGRNYSLPTFLLRMSEPALKLSKLKTVIKEIDAIIANYENISKALNFPSLLKDTARRPGAANPANPGRLSHTTTLPASSSSTSSRSTMTSSALVLTEPYEFPTVDFS